VLIGWSASAEGTVTQPAGVLTRATAAAPTILIVRAMFYGYLTLIVSGIVYFSIIGLTHH
jgi:hypothetical protein